MAQYQFAFWRDGYVRISEKHLLLLSILVDQQPGIAYFPALELEGQRGKPINVWVNSNAENIELFLNGKSLGKKDMPRNKHLEWKIPYEPGHWKPLDLKTARR